MSNRLLRLNAALPLLLTFPVLAGNDVSFGSGSSGNWSISVGPTWRQLGDLSLRGGSRSSEAAIPDLLTASAVNDPMVGTLDTSGQRVYDNGFVRPSGFTEATGLTSFWSYQDEAQVSPDSIRFDATGTRTEFIRNPAQSEFFNQNDDLEAFAPQIDLIFRPEHKPTFFKNLSGILFSLNFANTDSGSRFSNFTGSQLSNLYRRNFQDTYLLGGLQGNVPPAGFTGTFVGPGPLLPAIPDSREFSEDFLSSETALISNNGRTHLDLSSLSLAVGPIFEGKISARFSWQIACGTTFTFYDWDTSQEETLSASLGGVTQNLANFRDTASGTDFSVGVFARTTAVYHLSDDWFVNGSLQGELATSIEMNAGPSEYHFRPGGFSIGLGLGRNF